MRRASRGRQRAARGPRGTAAPVERTSGEPAGGARFARYIPEDYGRPAGGSIQPDPGEGVDARLGATAEGGFVTSISNFSLGLFMNRTDAISDAFSCVFAMYG